MAWTRPRFSRTQVNAAGRDLATGGLDATRSNEALEILNNWRASHSFPLNTFQMNLRRNATKAYRHALVAQRLKRTPSTIAKLRRFPSMSLSRMQDIGGCRGVLNTIAQVRNVEGSFLRSRIKHVLVRHDNYIVNPKNSGYRGVHLVYRYRSDKKTTYNGLLIEVQLRSRLQHAWATAVETVGTFLRESLKSSEGPERWLEFFTLTGSAFALVEGTPLVPGTPQNPESLHKQVSDLAEELNVIQRLETYGMALEILQDPDLKAAHFFLLSLNPPKGRLTVRGYSRGELDDAVREYLEQEKELSEISGAEAVLVAAQSVNALKRAYPNYFLDTGVFLGQLSEILD